MHGGHNLNFKLHMNRRIHFYRRPQVVHPCFRPSSNPKPTQSR